MSFYKYSKLLTQGDTSSFEMAISLLHRYWDLRKYDRLAMVLIRYLPSRVLCAVGEREASESSTCGALSETGAHWLIDSNAWSSESASGAI